MLPLSAAHARRLPGGAGFPVPDSTKTSAAKSHGTHRRRFQSGPAQPFSLERIRDTFLAFTSGSMHREMQKAYAMTDRIITDNSSVYDFAINEHHKKNHRKVNHITEWVVPGSRIHTNTVESAFSLLKRGLIGSFHRVSIKHLHRYLTEFEYRFNERSNEARFVKTTQRLLQGKTMPYKTLTAPTEA
jgi:hypothetical protein